MNPTPKRFISCCCFLGLIYAIYRILFHVQVPGDSRTYGTPMSVAIYYEALCPDSDHFINKQLLPAFYSLSHLMHLEMYAYGKAKTIVGANNSTRFLCQHGNDECVANMYHACVADVVTDQNQMLITIACMMKTKEIKEMKLCARLFAPNATEEVERCFDSQRAIDLHKLNGELTNGLSPPVSFVPTVSINGSVRDTRFILNNFKAEFCNLLSKENDVEGCLEH